jgi:hypothetical protein
MKNYAQRKAEARVLSDWRSGTDLLKSLEKTALFD